jgi:hypothetical protein
MRRTRIRIPTLVGSNRVKARRRNGRQLMPPRKSQLRKPMAENNRRAITSLMNGKVDRRLIGPRRDLN